MYNLPYCLIIFLDVGVVRNAYAISVWRKVKFKLEGRDPDPGIKNTVKHQVSCNSWFGFLFFVSRYINLFRVSQATFLWSLSSFSYIILGKIRLI